jgi:hypothetical protein
VWGSDPALVGMAFRSVETPPLMLQRSCQQFWRYSSKVKNAARFPGGAKGSLSQSKS